MTRSNTANQNPFTAFSALDGEPFEAMQKGYQKATEMAGKMTALHRASFSAMTESAQLATKGVSAMNTRAAAYAKQTAKSYTDASRKLVGAKSFQDVVEVETEYTRELFARGLEEMTAFTSLFFETAKKSTKPLNTHAGKTVERLQANS